MLRKVSLRLPIEVFEQLQSEALQFKISISDIIRGKIFEPLNQNSQNSKFSKESSSASNLQNQILEILTLLSKKEESDQETHLINLEILFLLRELLFERNAQVLKNVSERMDGHFGKERKNIFL